MNLQTLAQNLHNPTSFVVSSEQCCSMVEEGSKNGMNKNEEQRSWQISNRYVWKPTPTLGTGT